MTTETKKKIKIPGWIKLLVKWNPPRPLTILVYSFVTSLLDSVMLVVWASIILASVVSWGANAFHAPEVLGKLFAQWCIERGSCDLDTNLLSVAIGVLIPTTILVIILNGLSVKEDAPTGKSIYFDVLAELRRKPNSTATQIAKRTGNDVIDVHTILNVLYDEGEVRITESPGELTGVTYALIVKDDRPL